MNNRFSLFLMAAVIAFVAGWLFGNEMRPPAYEDISMAVWAVAVAVALVLGGAASLGRG